MGRPTEIIKYAKSEEASLSQIKWRVLSIFASPETSLASREIITTKTPKTIWYNMPTNVAAVATG